MIGFEFECHQGTYGAHLIAFDEMSGHGSIWPLRNWRAETVAIARRCGLSQSRILRLPPT
jgi:hypothetical protein